MMHALAWMLVAAAVVDWIRRYRKAKREQADARRPRYIRRQGTLSVVDDGEAA